MPAQQRTKLQNLRHHFCQRPLQEHVSLTCASIIMLEPPWWSRGGGHIVELTWRHVSCQAVCMLKPPVSWAAAPCIAQAHCPSVTISVSIKPSPISCTISQSLPTSFLTRHSQQIVHAVLQLQQHPGCIATDAVCSRYCQPGLRVYLLMHHPGPADASSWTMQSGIISTCNGSGNGGLWSS